MTSSGAPRVRWWRATRDQAQVSARESQGRAAQALVELDAALGRTRSLVQTYAEIDPGPEAQREVGGAELVVHREGVIGGDLRGIGGGAGAPGADHRIARGMP